MAKKPKKPAAADDFDDLIGDSVETSPKTKLPKKGQWPEQVPILIPADLCRKLYHHPDGQRHDLYGWLEEAFASEDGMGPLFSPVFTDAERMVLTVLEERGAGDLSLSEVSDDTRWSLAWICEVWNEAMHRLGYECPKEKRGFPAEEDLEE